MKVFDNYARYYDLLYHDKDYTGKARFIHKLLQKYAPNTRSILELGCGTGHHTTFLAESGYQKVHGIDCNPEMIDRAKKRLVTLPPEIATQLRFDLGDIRTVRLDEKFDAVIFLFHVHSYRTWMRDLLAAFLTAKNHLKPEGLFLFDCWYGPAVLSDLPAVRIKRLETEERMGTGIAEPVLYSRDDPEEVRYQIFVDNAVMELRETYKTRYLFKHEIEYLFERSGIPLIEYAGWMNEKIAGFDTWGIYFIGKV